MISLKFDLIGVIERTDLLQKQTTEVTCKNECVNLVIRILLEEFEAQGYVLPDHLFLHIQASMSEENLFNFSDYSEVCKISGESCEVTFSAKFV